MEKRESVPPWDGAGAQDRGREFAGHLFLGCLKSAALVVPRRLVGMGKAWSTCSSDASWAAIPHILASYSHRWAPFG